MPVTTPSSTVKSKRTIARPRWYQAAPGRSSTRVGRAAAAAPSNIAATASRPSIRSGVPVATAAASAVTRTSGASSRSRRRRSPPRAASRKASTTSQSAGVPPGPAARILARAREASFRVATGELSSIAAIVAKSNPKVSWSTNETRSAGVNRSSTTWRATPTVSASATSSAGSAPPAASRGSAGSGTRARSRSRHSRVTTVVSHPARLSMGSVVRSRRSHACCTTSSASPGSPRMPPAIRVSRARSASKASTSSMPVTLSRSRTSR